MRPITDDEVTRWRADTPGAASRVHLNNAGASLVPRPVVAAIETHLRLESELGGYEAAASAAGAVERAYADIAALVGAEPRNVAVTASATAAFAGALAAFDFAPGDVIVTTQADYISNQLMFLSLARRLGVRVARAADLGEGGVDPDAVRALLRSERPRLVAVSWVPTNTGLVQRAADVGAVCEAEGVPYLLDACQAVGQLPVDLRALRCDFLSATARKFLRGPRGIGFLVVSDRALARGVHPLLVDMRGAAWTAADAFVLADDARRFEQWEFAYALVLGLGAAARYAFDAGVERTGARAHGLAAEARRRLPAIPGVRALDRGAALSAIAAFECAARAAGDVMLALRARGINTTAQSRHDALIDLDRKGAKTSLRVSPHYFNTTGELDTLEGALRDVLAS
ncbi:MAG TPA: aminotransferase class V-fold PLP-dependent enzyme [Gemmatimonadaceae bacterium]|nr:aminotransferase class V-fold PLP-dependent enzyme [Gemmatimonadaceae bacterium]